MNKNLSKVIFLGYDPHTTRNVLYYDIDTHIIILYPHVIFDYGMNDLTMADSHLYVQLLQRVNNGQPLPEEQFFFPVIKFELSTSPFTEIITVLLKSTTYSPDTTFVFTLQYCYLLKISVCKDH